MRKTFPRVKGRREKDPPFKNGSIVVRDKRAEKRRVLFLPKRKRKCDYFSKFFYSVMKLPKNPLKRFDFSEKYSKINKYDYALGRGAKRS